MRANVLVVLTAASVAVAAASRPAHGQERADRQVTTLAPEAASLEPRLRFQRLDRQRGLPQNSVNAVVQDRTGFMWLGTEDGLARYDGQRFITYRHDAARDTSLSASFVTVLFVGRDGTLWIGTQGGGVNRYRPARDGFERVDAGGEPGPLNAGTVTSMAEGPDGNIWIGTLEGGVAVLDPATGKARTYSIEDGLSPVVSAVAVGKQGAAWIGTPTGLYRKDPAKPGFELLFADDERLKKSAITALLLVDDAELWIGTEGDGLVRYAPATGKSTVFRADPARPGALADDAIKSIYRDRQGRVWVGTEKALHMLAPPGDRFERHAPDTGDPMSLGGEARAMYQDAAGVLWVGTFGGGAGLLDPRSLELHFYKTAPVTTLRPHGEDLWVSTFANVCRWRGKAELEGVCYPTGMANNVLVDRRGTVWVGTWSSGLLRLDRGSTDRWTNYTNDPSNPRSLAPGAVLDLYEDRAGQLWISFLDGGLQRFEPRREEFQSFQLPTETVYAIQEDPARNGVLWVGTGDAGILRIDTAGGEVKPYIPSPGDRSRRTENAVVDFAFAGDVIWLATYGGGLKRLDTETGKFTSFQRGEGIPSDTLCAVLTDRSGALWVSSIAGLARWEAGAKRGQLFGTADGLQSVEFAQHSRAVDAGGRLLFGGVNGFNAFRPEEIEIDRYAAPLVLTSIRILDQPYRGGEAVGSLRRLELEHDEGLVAIEFAALSFSSSDDIRFEYKIDGIEEQWLGTDSASVSLAGLDTGDYRLHVRARNRHGTESKPIALEIVVAPPLYLTWWALLLYFLTFAGLVAVIYRSQKARITRLKNMARLSQVEREFEVTATVQSWFLPRPGLHRSGRLDIVGFYRGAEKCSGDWWWFEDVGDGKLWVIVADVTGHGAGPAMLTAAVAMGLWVQTGSAHEEIVERLSRVNGLVLDRCKGKAMVSMTAALLDQQTGELVVYGLGGVPALILTRDGKHRVLSARGSPLGGTPQLDAGTTAATLGPGERLLITTDGIIETRLASSSRNQLGFRRFLRMAHGTAAIPLDQAADEIVHEVDLVRGLLPQEDDFTFCLVERRE